jgi:hypothetical protein
MKSPASMERKDRVAALSAPIMLDSESCVLNFIRRQRQDVLDQFQGILAQVVPGHLLAQRCPGNNPFVQSLAHEPKEELFLFWVGVRHIGPAKI